MIVAPLIILTLGVGRVLVDGKKVLVGVEKWCITSALKVWLSGGLSEFLFSTTKASKVRGKVFHTD